MIQSRLNNEREWKSFNNNFNVTKKLNSKTIFINKEFEKLKKGKTSFEQLKLSLSPTKKICSKYYPSSSLVYKNNKNDPGLGLDNYYNINTSSTVSLNSNINNNKFDFANEFIRNNNNNKQRTLRHYQLNTKSSILHFQKDAIKEESSLPFDDEFHNLNHNDMIKIISKKIPCNKRYKRYSNGWTNCFNISFLILLLYINLFFNVFI